MNEYRQVKKEVTGVATQDGAGVKLTRVLGKPTVEEFDPFLMLDAFDSKNPEDYTKGFPWHPHRGIETVTYLIAGEMEHGDSMGGSGVIRGGDTQWMTAGSGIIHQEFPRAAPRMMGAQLWINLPQKDKMAPPAYNSIEAKDVPSVQEDGALVKVIAGKYKETLGAFEGDYVKTNYLDVAVRPEAKWVYGSHPDKTLFVYIYEGSAYFAPGEDELFAEKRALLFGPGEKVYVHAGGKGVGFLLLEALPLHEPVAWGGPVVMNTRSELDEAFAELDRGTFVKHKRKMETV